MDYNKLWSFVGIWLGYIISARVIVKDLSPNEFNGFLAKMDKMGDVDFSESEGGLFLKRRLVLKLMKGNVMQYSKI